MGKVGNLCEIEEEIGFREFDFYEGQEERLKRWEVGGMK